MIADLPIYRRDDVRGEYYVVFDKESIFKIAKKWAAEYWKDPKNKQRQKESGAANYQKNKEKVLARQKVVLYIKLWINIPNK